MAAAEAWLVASPAKHRLARQIDVDKDRVRPQLGAKTQARLALGGGTNDLYLTGVVQQFRQVLGGKGLRMIAKAQIPPVRFAVEEANAEGTSPAFELAVYDDHGDENKSQEVARRVVSIEEVPFV